MPLDVLGLPRLGECLEKIKLEPSVFQHCLPKKDATAGAALSHCMDQVFSILKREYPCVFKFGFTHCLSWRWNNRLYGYKKNTDKYHTMIAVYVSSAIVGAALMEAVLIKEYFGNSF